MKMHKGATLSDDGVYRYALWRIEDPAKPLVLFLGLNPSTADEESDDPTVRRCVRFAHDWGYGGVLIGNLYGLRATNPRELETSESPVGPENDAYLERMAGKAGLVVAAWGADHHTEARVRAVLELLSGQEIWCLGLTRSLAPRHPLYMRATAVPAPFPAAYDGKTERPSPTQDQWLGMIRVVRESYTRREADAVGGHENRATRSGGRAVGDARQVGAG